MNHNQKEHSKEEVKKKNVCDRATIFYIVKQKPSLDLVTKKKNIL